MPSSCPSPQHDTKLWVRGEQLRRSCDKVSSDPTFMTVEIISRRRQIMENGRIFRESEIHLG